MENIEQQYLIWNEFLELWSESAIEAMTIDQYTDLDNKDTFTYWLEHRLKAYGSIRGGSSYKFGIFRKSNTEKEHSNTSYLSDDKYAWHQKFGNTAATAFSKVKEEILAVIHWIKNEDLTNIESSSLAHTLKWKIAYHYQSQQKPLIIGVFNVDALHCYFKRKISMRETSIELKEKLSYTTLFNIAEDIWTVWGKSKAIKIWKVSHGYGELPDDSWLNENSYLTVHEETGKSQGSKFADTVQIGDFVNLSRSGEIKALVRVTSDVEENSDSPYGSEWQLRRYEIIQELPQLKKYTSVKKGWSPNYNNTLGLVKPEDLPLFEKEILQPFYEITISELILSPVSEVKEHPVVIGDITTVVPPQHPSNLIYFGPPGTGKTYKIQQLIKQKYISKADVPEYDLWLRCKLEPLNWMQVLVLCLLELGRKAKVKEITEHSYFKCKASMNGRSSNLANTAWSYLQKFTVTNSETVNFKSRSEPAVFDKTPDSYWHLVEDKLELIEDLEALYKEIDLGPQSGEIVERFNLITFHQSYGYEEFIEGLCAETDDSGNITYRVKDGAFKELCRRAEADPSHRYAMFIDEINRGNISKIFGELISLIELDKRKGGKNPLTVKLPYSSDPFSVPSNVDLIGTMNTADRSLTVMDTALRRRFDFQEMMPEYDLLSGIEVAGIELSDLLEVINSRIEYLYDREHTLGHAFFMPVVLAQKENGQDAAFKELKSVFKSKIIPLLEEYFFEDWHKIRLVLGDNQKDDEFQFIREEKVGSKKSLEFLFGKKHNIETYSSEESRYFFNEEAFDCEEAYQGIIGSTLKIIEDEAISPRDGDEN